MNGRGESCECRDVAGVKCTPPPRLVKLHVHLTAAAYLSMGHVYILNSVLQIGTLVRRSWAYDDV